MATAMDKASGMFSMDNIRNGLLKLMEDLFRHVMQLTEGIESATGYDFSNVTREFEKFAFESGFVPPSEDEYGLDFEYASGYTFVAEPSSDPDFAYAFESTSESTSEPKPVDRIDFSQVFNLYDKTMGLSVQRVLTEVAGEEIDRFYHSIKQKILNPEKLKVFLQYLVEKFLNKSAEKELYFLSVVSRIFTHLYKSDGMNPKVFIEEVVDAMIRCEKDLQLVSVNPPELFLDILNDSNKWIRKFFDLNCGNASDYFARDLF